MATKQSSRRSSSRKPSSPSSGDGGRNPASPRAGQASKAASRAAPGERRSGGRKTTAKSATRQSARSAPPGRKTPGTSARRSAAPDALKLLTQDHENVDQMFKRYERMKEGDGRKQALRETILSELTVHAKVEEELFYPALKALFEAAGKDKAVDLIDEADVEHASLKWLIEQLEDQGDEAMTDARVKVLGEYVRHHVEEEQGEIFKAAKKVDIDLVELGRRMEARKRELKGEGDADSEAGGDSVRTRQPARIASEEPQR